MLQGVPREDWERQLEELRAAYARDERGLQVVEVAGGFQITTRPEYNDWVRELLDPRTPTRLSIQALETKAEMIATFLALLELIRLKRVRVYQRGMFGPIRVFRPVGPPAEGAPGPAT